MLVVSPLLVTLVAFATKLRLLKRVSEKNILLMHDKQTFAEFCFDPMIITVVG